MINCRNFKKTKYLQISDIFLKLTILETLKLILKDKFQRILIIYRLKIL